MDGFLKRFSCGFFPQFSVLCIWNRTFPHPPPPFPPNPEGTSLPLSHTSSSFSKREIPRCTQARSLEKKIQSNKLENKTTITLQNNELPVCPQQQEEEPWSCSWWTYFCKLQLRSQICHASHLRSFSRVAIQFWPYSNLTHRTAALPCQNRNYTKPAWSLFSIITEVDLVGWIWSNSIVTLQLESKAKFVSIFLN